MGREEELTHECEERRYVGVLEDQGQTRRYM
jgi:hypothetical protein